MDRASLRIGLVVGCLLASFSARPAAAVTDVTGSWHLAYTLMSFPVEEDVDVVQTGTALTLSNGFSGTIDPATGVFQVEAVLACGGTNHPAVIQGTFAPDASLFVAQFQRVVPSGLSCIVSTGSGVGQRQPPTASTPNLLAAKKIDLADAADPARKKLVAKSSDPSLSLGLGDGSADDPTLHGGALRVRTETGDVMYPLPAANWTSLGANRGYRYKDAKRLAGPVTAVKVRAGRTLTVTAKGAALLHSLVTDPHVVEVVLYLGARRSCLGGAGIWKPGAKFTVSKAPAPSQCAWP